ncbi:MAG: hypothetical protein KDH96_02990 [Candidatus Riesia sp.]|nr:hypothetical protein [Candidatus Riesia sp.]
MEKLLQMLVQSNLLNEGSLAAVKTEVETLINETKLQAEAEVKAQLTEQWMAERELLVESLDAKLTDLFESEIADLKQDIDDFRDLEVEFANKLEQEKQILAEGYENQLEQLIETLDTFIENRLAVELQEFADDLEQAKKNQFAIDLFETFAPQFKERFLSDDETHRALEETQAQLAEAQAQLAKTQELHETTQRNAKVTELLSTLGENQRKIMSTLLENVATENLDTMFTRYIDVVIAKSSTKTEDKATKTQKTSKQLNENTAFVQGNTTPVVNTSTQTVSDTDLAERKRLRKLAGLD